MTVHPKELRDVFDAAVEIDDSLRRDHFIQSACAGNEPLRSRVEELLRAHEVAGGFCNAPGMLKAAPKEEFDERRGDLPSESIGRYKLLQKLGEGGCGAVFMAEQTEPVKRRVALKIIKLGMDTRSVIARFEAERQALAMMDHPHIARVFDAGATEAGRPFFVMELVRGIKITDYCDQNQLSTNARLELFTQVCQAVQHAHQKGVIHRDLKPSNVLVTSNDGTPMAKVIDFGVAKATSDQRLTDKTLFTRFEMFIGTPAYMSPEQAEFNASDVDTRTDIYALGVLLYELLTGRTPFDSETLLQSGLDAMRRAIRDTDPPRPSTRLNTLAAADLAEVAKRRQAEPPKLISLVRGDLDWIVLKALEKDRTRRYETANALAMDVQRHLQHEPIVARPRSVSYSFQKMVQRNRAAFIGAIAVLVMLVLGVIASTWQAVRATRAEQNQRQLRLIADDARQEATRRAEESDQQLVRLHLATGNKLVEEGDYFGALLRFVEALRLDAGRPEREEIHRRRLASLLRASPVLAQMWFFDDFVHSAEFSPDGSRVVGAGLDQTARVWDTASGEPVLPPIRQSAALDFACFTADGRRLITVAEGLLRFWNAQTGEAIGTTASVTVSDLRSVASSPDGRWLVAPVPGGWQRFRTDTGEAEGPKVATTNQLDRVRFSPDGTHLAGFGFGTKAGGFWDLSSGPRLAATFSHEQSVRFADFHPSGGQIATVSGGRTLNVWDTVTGRPVWPSFTPGGDLYDCRFSPDGRRLATASWNGMAQIFDAKTGHVLSEPMHHRAGVAKSVFSPDGRWLATASWDNTARLWDSRTGRPASPSLHHAGFVRSANFSPEGKHLLTAGQDQTIRLWALSTNSPARLVLHQGGALKKARFSPDGKRVLTCADTPLRVWDAVTGRKLCSLSHSTSFGDANFSPDGKRVLVGGLDGIARVWDISDPTKPAVLVTVEHAGETKLSEFSPDGESFLTAGSREARLWRTSDGQLIGVLRHLKLVRHATFSRDGRRVITASLDGTARIWDAQTGLPVGTPLQHPCGVMYAQFSPDGRRVVTAAWDLTLLARAGQIWDAATSQPVGSPLQHQDGLYHAEFSPNGRMVATSSEDNAAMIWDAATGQRLAGPLQHTDTAVMARFSPDSRLLLTVSSDFTARVWDVTTGEAVTPPLRHDAPLKCGEWRADGREILTAAEDGTARVWDISPTEAPLRDLQRQAELLAAHRLDARTGAVLLTPTEMRERWQAMRRGK